MILPFSTCKSQRDWDRINLTTILILVQILECHLYQEANQYNLEYYDLVYVSGSLLVSVDGSCSIRQEPLNPVFPRLQCSS